jgi:very-short-patch-repair endonuclease
MWKGANPQNFSNAKNLRENMTNAELIFWNRVKNKQFHGLKFRRQHPIHKYIADFYCHKLKLIIEIDGDYHNTSEQKNYDILRTKDLNFQDIKILRFKNDEVENEIEEVLKTIENYIHFFGSL